MEQEQWREGDNQDNTHWLKFKWTRTSSGRRYGAYNLISQKCWDRVMLAILLNHSFFFFGCAVFWKHNIFPFWLGFSSTVHSKCFILLHSFKCYLVSFKVGLRTWGSRPSNTGFQPLSWVYSYFYKFVDSNNSLYYRQRLFYVNNWNFSVMRLST